MSPTVVLVVGLVGIGCLLRLYRSVYPWPAWTLWVPQVWLIILSSRMLSLWFNPGGGGTADALEEGSPFDRIVFIVLILAAAAIVMTRWRSRCCAIIKQNPAVFSFLGFAGLSLIWSDLPDVGLKRYVKEIGNILMVLVVLSDERPKQAAQLIIGRCVYILIPMSIIVWKYFPEYGRQYHRITGELMIIGVGTGKNSLGALCMVAFLFCGWRILHRERGSPDGLAGLDHGIGHSGYLGARQEPLSTGRQRRSWTSSPFQAATSGRRGDRSRLANRMRLLTDLVMCSTAGWLLLSIDSLTALALTGIGTLILLAPKVGSRWQVWIRPIAIASMVLAILSTPVLVSVGPSEHEVLESMDGHEETFWGRVSFWPELSMLSNGTPLLGVGYGTYWLGSRLRTIWAKYGWSPTQAHNGYVETYLEVGFIGVALLVWFLLSAGCDAVRGIIREGSSWSALRLAFLLIGTVYNITEAAFKGHHIIWFYLLLLGFSSLLSSAVQPAQLPATGSTGVLRPAWPVFAHWYVRRANVQPYARQSQPPKPLR